MKKTGTSDSKTRGNAFFFSKKTESVSWGLPLMNGGLTSNKHYPKLEENLTTTKLVKLVLITFLAQDPKTEISKPIHH